MQTEGGWNDAAWTMLWAQNCPSYSWSKLLPNSLSETSTPAQPSLSLRARTPKHHSAQQRENTQFRLQHLVQTQKPYAARSSYRPNVAIKLTDCILLMARRWKVVFYGVMIWSASEWAVSLSGSEEKPLYVRCVRRLKYLTELWSAVAGKEMPPSVWERDKSNMRDEIPSHTASKMQYF